MRKYNRFSYSTARVSARRRPLRRKKRSYFFFRLFLLLLTAGILIAGGGLALSKAYETLTQAEITNWHVRLVEISGVQGPLLEELTALSAPYQATAFSSGQTAVLRKQIETEYPMLTDVSVARKLLSGKLKISAQLRKPVAQLRLADGSVRYLDQKSMVYADDTAWSATGDLIRVELAGEVPEQLDHTFVEMLRSMIKMQKNLPFSALKLDMTTHTVMMTLPDKSEIVLGPVTALKAKVKRAADVMNYVREHEKGPVRIDFSFFEYGKVFLTQKAH